MGSKKRYIIFNFPISMNSRFYASPAIMQLPMTHKQKSLINSPIPSISSTEYAASITPSNSLQRHLSNHSTVYLLCRTMILTCTMSMMTTCQPYRLLMRRKKLIVMEKMIMMMKRRKIHSKH